YADLGARLRDAVGGTDHTWCTFAVWASATAGLSIRRQELDDVVVELTRSMVKRQARVTLVLTTIGPPVVKRIFSEALDAISERLAHGNTLVFAELAPLFVTALPWWERAPADAGAPSMGQRLRLTHPDVTDDLVVAFDWYDRAVRATAEAPRAWAVCAANVVAVAHEQQRLEPDIKAALDEGLDVVEALVDTRLRIGRRWFRRHLAAHLAAVWEELVTLTMMSLRVPGEELHLGGHVPPLPDGTTFPAALEDLARAAAAGDPYRRWDPHDGELHHRTNWAVLDDRMSYIARLFRSRQQHPPLGAAPFSADQLGELAAGRVPAPPLLPERPTPRPKATSQPA
ncbi:MAG: hypothetical protein ACK5OX_14040, partial [Desertimonas sp.]